MRNLVLGLTRVLLRSILLMAMTFVILMSVMTHEFPPNLKRVSQAYQYLKEYQGSVPSALTATTATTPSAASSVEDDDIAKLSELYEKRARFGRALLDPTYPQPPPLSTTFSERGEIEILKAQLLTCQDELAHLQNQGDGAPNDPLRDDSQDH